MKDEERKTSPTDKTARMVEVTLWWKWYVYTFGDRGVGVWQLGCRGEIQVGRDEIERRRENLLNTRERVILWAPLLTNKK